MLTREAVLSGTIFFAYLPHELGTPPDEETKNVIRYLEDRKLDWIKILYGDSILQYQVHFTMDFGNIETFLKQREHTLQRKNDWIHPNWIVEFQRVSSFEYSDLCWRYVKDCLPPWEEIPELRERRLQREIVEKQTKEANDLAKLHTKYQTEVWVQKRKDKALKQKAEEILQEGIPVEVPLAESPLLEQEDSLIVA
jgi:hypothetical protein